MPYARNDDLPASVRDALPTAAQTRFRTVVNSALERGLSEEKAFASAWTAVKNGWKKPDDGGKWQRINKAAARTLFASRPLENADRLILWAKSQGFKTTLPAEDMHVTEIYSKTPLKWPEPFDDVITVRETDGRTVEPLGNEGAVVLRFNSPSLTERHEQLKRAGAKSDFEGYKGHVTITWDADGVDLSKVEPYDGELIFGPERFKPVDPNWSPKKIVEKERRPNRVIVVSAIDSEDQLTPMLETIRHYAAQGHSFPIVVDPGDSEYERKFFFDGDGPDRILELEAAHVTMEKAGARHSAADRALIQKMHDDAVALGASCSGQSNYGKGSDGEPFQAFAKAQVLKVDEALGLVFGWAIVSKVDGVDYFDVQDDHIPEESMLKAATDFMLSERVAKEMHFGEDKGKIVFAFPLTTDIAKAMGITTKQTGLMIAMKPDNADLLAKFKSGEYTGFSIGGRRIKDEPEG